MWKMHRLIIIVRHKKCQYQILLTTDNRKNYSPNVVNVEVNHTKSLKHPKHTHQKKNLCWSLDLNNVLYTHVLCQYMACRIYFMFLILWVREMWIEAFHRESQLYESFMGVGIGTIPSRGQNLQVNEKCRFYTSRLHPIQGLGKSAGKISSLTYLYKYLIPRRDSKVWPNISCAAVAWA